MCLTMKVTLVLLLMVAISLCADNNTSTENQTNKANFIAEIRHKSLFSLLPKTIDNDNVVQARNILALAPKLFCMGTVISERFVLGLKSCVIDSLKSTYEIVVGSSSLLGNYDTSYNIEQIIPHTLEDDIALYQTDKKIILDPNDIAKVSNEAITGKIQLYTLTLLSKTGKSVTIVDSSKCDSMFRKVSKMEICVEDVPCFAVPGAPLIDEKNQIVGLHLGLAELNCIFRKPSIAADVTKLSEWITDSTK